MTSLKQYINNVKSAYYQKDGIVLTDLISISSPEVVVRSQYSPAFAETAIQALPDPKWQQMVATHLELLRALVVKQDIIECFNLAIQMLECLNRCAEKQDRWILPALYNNIRELRRIYRTKAELKFDKSDEITKSLEQMARVFSTSFQICLNDRNADLDRSKRQGVYFFIDELFKIYSILQNFDLARSTEKAFRSLRHELPQFNKIPKSHTATYLYFSGAISCAENDLTGAHEKLCKALSYLSPVHHKHQIQSILILLIPIKFSERKQFPNKRLWSEFPILKSLYYSLFKAIFRGDLKSFDKEFRKIENLMLKRQLYVVVLNLRTLVILKLFEQVWRLLDQKHHISVSAFQLALEFSSSHRPVTDSQFKYSLDAAESHMARLIASGHIKGYLSHGNRVAVLSKNNPFPTFKPTM